MLLIKKLNFIKVKKKKKQNEEKRKSIFKTLSIFLNEWI